MSSEQEAYEDLWRRLAEHAPMTTDETLDVDEALNEWKQQIERRVLAQQPCYRTWNQRGLVVHDCEAIEAVLRPARIFCPTCTARQTQETSG